MSKDIQEAIENLYEALPIKYECKDYPNRIVNKDDLITVLNYIETLEKENKKWEDYCTNDLEKQITDLNNKNFELENKLKEKSDFIDYIQGQKADILMYRNVVPKEVIEEKIKELLEIKHHSNDSIAISSANIIINFLQELLENK